MKSYAYHENLNLFLKQRVAEFEANNQNVEEIFEEILNVLKSDDCFENELFKKWIDSVDYHLLPKLVERHDVKSIKKKQEGLFLSNVRDSDKYQISKVNYFIKAPVEVHLIEIMWCLFVGPVLELKVSKDIYGNRMHSNALDAMELDNVNGQEIFKRYIDQYDLWRDQAINVAADISKNGDDVALLSLDLKSYFYHVDVDFDEINKEISQYYNQDLVRLEIAQKFNKILKKVYLKYQDSVLKSLRHTHAKCKNKKCLPIGMASSSIIANWYLSDFDLYVDEQVRPAYYGRYVDDIIMVFRRPKIDINDPINSFMEHYLSDLISADDDLEYFIKVNNNSLPIQKDKLILQFFDKDHSRAGLDLFKQELDERSSAFKFLPSEHIDNDLDRFAYDVLYDGSVNKIRSVIGLAENETELAKYLASHITAHRLCRLDKKNTVIPQVKQFFKGQNALQFFRFWEKIYQYAIVTGNYSFVGFFYEYILSEIVKTESKSLKINKSIKYITDKIHSDLKKYNQISLSITIGLLDLKEYNYEFYFLENLDDSFFKKPKVSLDKIISDDICLHKLSWEFRFSNLIRHHLVAWPLANFSNYEGDLTIEAELIGNADISIDDRKIDLSPRFIHFDEWQIFYLSERLGEEDGLNKWIETSLLKYQKKFLNQALPVVHNSSTVDENNIIKSSLRINDGEVKSEITLAIANLKINENDISFAIRKDTSPNLTFERQEKLYNILNNSLKEKSDLLVMPEVAIPVSWLPFMVSFSRRHQIGLVFGLEHWVADDFVYNLIFEVLPFKIDGKYNSCIVKARLKNHYAPSELELISSLRLKPGNLNSLSKNYYHKVSWRGISFATYNCFELSDITHRVIFKSEIDLLFACVWNKDTNYYQHILESAVRDLHCYTVQANTSQYGGSCILRPTKTESKTMLYVKGGENSCVLTTKLDIKGLREFQYKSKPNLIDKFKHLPPGYDSDSVLDR